MSGYRPIYTREEDMLILNGIIETESYYRVKGRVFWRDLANTGYTDRTWQSLKERFDKHIFPRINDYEVLDEQKKKIQLALYQLDENNYRDSTSDSDSTDSDDDSEDDSDQNKGEAKEKDVTAGV